MSQTLEIAGICEFMKTHVVDVFETMLATKAVLSNESKAPQFAERISGSVGFAGDSINGAVYIHFSNGFATKAAATMLGLKPEDVTNDAEVNDVIGEVANMVTGGLKSWLCDAGAPCAMSTPAIIRGTSFSIEPMPDVSHTCMIFECGEERVVVEIHVKFN
jgi:chemotaxis protein CheX